MNQVLTVTIEGQVALLTLNRPQKLNAMNNELVDVMLGCLDEIELDPRVRAVVITGAGRAFSAGAEPGRISRPFSLTSRPGPPRPWRASCGPGIA